MDPGDGHSRLSLCPRFIFIVLGQLLLCRRLPGWGEWALRLVVAQPLTADPLVQSVGSQSPAAARLVALLHVGLGSGTDLCLQHQQVDSLPLSNGAQT